MDTMDVEGQFREPLYVACPRGRHFGGPAHLNSSIDVDSPLAVRYTVRKSSPRVSLWPVSLK